MAAVGVERRELQLPSVVCHRGGEFARPMDVTVVDNHHHRFDGIR